MRFVSLGESMIELAQAGEDPAGRPGTLLRQGFAGDTLNTAWYARALLPAAWQVDYATVVGRDALSDQMVDFIAAAGLGVAHIARHPTRVAGLYLISLLEGERSFTYWRDRSAARTLADDPLWLAAAIEGAAVIYISGITVAILDPEGRARLRAALDTARKAGSKIVFDPNLRPRLWEDARTMCAQTEATAAGADIVLPSFEDEASHFGDATPGATALRYQRLGAGEVLVKNGGGPMAAALGGGALLALPELDRRVPVDTTGAGDSFNGGYLAARLSGADLETAVRAGHAVASKVIARHGALVDLTA